MLARGEDAAEENQTLATVEDALADYKVDLWRVPPTPRTPTARCITLGPALLRRPLALLTERN